MKCTNRIFCLFISLIFTASFVTGCGEEEIGMKFDLDTNVSSFSVNHGEDDRAVPFASNLCVTSGNDGSIQEIEEGADSYGAAALFDVKNSNVIYADNALVSLYPASMTKVMTAICAMKYGNKDDMITCTSNVHIDEDGAQVCGLNEGDRLTLDQAMHGLLMYSGNDAAIAIAEEISGSVEGFCDLMNQEAAILGATNSHFVNPNGLHDEDHYSTAYDMYLIFNEAVKYDWFNEIINMQTYTTSYQTKDGDSKEVTWNTTNLYLKGDKIAPSKITVIGGKTGTTSAAGANLVLLSRDAGGNPYISVVMKAESRDTLYNKMTNVLEEIP